jgi:hypothetical protein
MKSKEEIEQLAFLEYPRLINDPYNPMEDDNTYERQIWIDAYTQCQEDMADNSKVTRFEVIDENGRVYTKHNCTIELSYQDDSRTLKVFINSLNKQD